MRAIVTTVCSGLLAFSLAGLTGCYDEIQHETAQEPQRAPQGGAHPVGQSGGSTLGGARRAADNVVSGAEAQSQELADSIGND